MIFFRNTASRRILLHSACLFDGIPYPTDRDIAGNSRLPSPPPTPPRADFEKALIIIRWSIFCAGMNSSTSMGVYYLVSSPPQTSPFPNNQN